MSDASRASSINENLSNGQPLPTDADYINSNSTINDTNSTNETITVTTTTAATSNISTLQPVTLYTIEPFVIPGHNVGTSNIGTNIQQNSNGSDETKQKRPRGRPPKSKLQDAREWIGVTGHSANVNSKTKQIKRKATMLKNKEPPIDTFALWQILNEKYGKPSNLSTVKSTSNILNMAMESAQIGDCNDEYRKMENNKRFKWNDIAFEPGYFLCMGEVRSIDVTNNLPICNYVKEIFSNAEESCRQSEVSAINEEKEKE